MTERKSAGADPESDGRRGAFPDLRPRKRNPVLPAQRAADLCAYGGVQTDSGVTQDAAVDRSDPAICGRGSGNAFVKAVHAEKGRDTGRAFVIHMAPVRHFFHKDAVGGHAGALQLRKTAGLSRGDGAGLAQAAAADADHCS